jgi:hypothetical protein
MTIDRIAQFLSLVGRYSLYALLLSIPLHIGHARLSGRSAIPLYLIAHGTAFSLMTVAVLSRAFLLAAKDAQPRVLELVGCTGVLSLILAVWLPPTATDPGWWFELILKTVAGLGATSAGALWGWSAIRRLDEQRTGVRLLILGAGWAALAALPAAGYVLAHVFGMRGTESRTAWIAAGVALLIVPGWYIEHRAGVGSLRN